MKYYWSQGGSTDPGFRYKVSIKRPDDDMIKWCDEYPSEEYERWCVQWASYTKDTTFQFEVEKHAILFKLKFGDQ